jgi:molecular chaperone GrpE
MENDTVIRKKQNPFERPVDGDAQQGSDPLNQDAEAAGDQIQHAEEELEQAGEDLQQAEDALSAAEQEVARHRDAMLRMQAEMDNTRKRLVRDAEKSRRFALERIMKDLLQVLDTMERGLQAGKESATVESLLEGQELTLKMLTKVLSEHNLELVDPAGEPFNPEFHEAVTMLPSPDHEEGTVTEVLQKGYKLHDRLVRPAMVVVSSKP